MKIPPARAEAFLKNPSPDIAAVLVYGPNAGLVSEHADRVAGAVAPKEDPFRTSELTGAELRSDPGRLCEEALALSLVGGRRVVRVREAGDALAAAFADCLALKPRDSLFVVEAGDLAARSPLRKLFESEIHAAALACYADEPRDLGAVIERTLAKDGIVIEPAAIDYLLARLSGDRLVIRGEIEKLALFASRSKRIALDDVMTIIEDSGSSSLEEIAFAAASGETEELERALARAYRSDLMPVSILRAAIKHFLRLHLVSGQMREGRALAEALQTLRPPPFFKVAPRFKRQATAWDADRIEYALALLNEAERACKTTGNPAESICAHALFRIAAGSKAAPREGRRGA